MKKIIDKKYLQFITELKQSILQSRYNAARVVNRELLWLYYQIGKVLSDKITAESWGAKVMENISVDLQNELPGLRGFSAANLKKMRHFYESYPSIGSTVSSQFDCKLKVLSSKGLRRSVKVDKNAISIGSTLSSQFEKTEQSEFFFSLSFSHHLLILLRCKKSEERWFYIIHAVKNQWSYRMLEYHIESNLYKKKGKMPNNFAATLPENIKDAALLAFKDEYLLDFINIEEEDDERVLEKGIVNNIRKFIMHLGKGFSFIGSQHRLIVEGDEFFVDLLFYNRHLQCLVAFELKRGKFKPEYAGKLNFYLNALDDQVKLEHENPSIGIILCKEKKNAVVEYAFKTIKKAMGVATYQLSTTVPKNMKGILPDAEQLKKIL